MTKNKRRNLGMGWGLLHTIDYVLFASCSRIILSTIASVGQQNLDLCSALESWGIFSVTRVLHWFLSEQSKHVCLAKTHIYGFCMSKHYVAITQYNVVLKWIAWWKQKLKKLKGFFWKKNNKFQIIFLVNIMSTCIKKFFWFVLNYKHGYRRTSMCILLHVHIIEIASFVLILRYDNKATTQTNFKNIVGNT